MASISLIPGTMPKRGQVFRTNASYSRWDEGRRSFGSITTVSRDIARQVCLGSGQGACELNALVATGVLLHCHAANMPLSIMRADGGLHCLLQAFAWFRPDDYESRVRVGRWLVALGRSTMVHLREEHDMEVRLRGPCSSSRGVGERRGRARPMTEVWPCLCACSCALVKASG